MLWRKDKFNTISKYQPTNMPAGLCEDLVKCGYLEMKLPRKQRKMAHKVWKRKWFVLRRKSPQGKPRLEYCSSEKSCAEGKNRTIITLDGITDITRAQSRTHAHTIMIVSKEVKLFLASGCEKESKEWLRLMKELVLPEPKMFPSIKGGDIYGFYEVTVIRTYDSERLHLAGVYLMTVLKQFLSLHNSRTGDRIQQWELEHLPRFRLQRLSHLQDRDKILIIKAGRGCRCGEGEFQFLTRHGREILETVKCQTQRLVNSRKFAANRVPSVESVPCTRSSENETVDSLTSGASFNDTESRDRSVSNSSHHS